jgi:hypothetical protein
VLKISSWSSTTRIVSVRIFSPYNRSVIDSGLSAPFGPQTTDGVIEGRLQPLGGSVHGIKQSSCLVDASHWLTPLETGFNHTAFVVPSALVAILVTEMDFHPCDSIANVAQGSLNDGFNLRDQLFAARNVLVGHDLDLHDFSFRFTISHVVWNA